MNIINIVGALRKNFVGANIGNYFNLKTLIVWFCHCYSFFKAYINLKEVDLDRLLKGCKSYFFKGVAF